MAKSYQLKEMTDCEIGDADEKSFGNPKKNGFEVKTPKFSSESKFLDELRLWRIAMQIEMFGPNRSNQK
jgi:hypothetical protein